ncbi:hypothetical protein I4F81_001431 [Pyropia yezoensis]|uniref:Uncharacterized protein n=1 Tax=Pyropia yezoensis TaxID=2788 RepID=A0ACC3BMW6_PYRYE|nr:hypothetical protein I4F81_001431 [Neopyropia yezoensis]|eukprot:contig_10122_g2418
MAAAMIPAAAAAPADAAAPRRRHKGGPAGRVGRTITTAAAATAGVAAQTLSFSERMVAGAIARGVAQTSLHPVDVVRTRLQAKGVARNWAPSVFLKGVLPQILLALPAGAVQFAAFEAAKDKFATLLPGEKNQQVRDLLSGACGAIAAASFRVPQEVIKQRIQADIYPNMAVAVKTIAAAEGPAGFYRGALATMSRDVPWNALAFLFHGQAKSAFASVKGRKPNNQENLGLAGFSGAIAAIIMTPVDVVKTRLMTQRAGGVQYKGIFNTLTRIVREEGAGTLMKGVVPRVMFLAPLAGITFSVYEGVAKTIKQRKARAAIMSGQLTDASVGGQVPTVPGLAFVGPRLGRVGSVVGRTNRAVVCRRPAM